MHNDDAFDRARRKRAAVNSAESSGQVADNMEVRKELMRRVHAGEITLAHAQAELRRIQRNARKNGQVTRAQAFRHG